MSLTTRTLSRRRLVLAALSLPLVGFAATLSGCPANKSGSASATGSSKPGVFRYPLTANPTTFDPALVSDGATIDVIQQTYQGLVGWNEKSEVTPVIAKELPKISDDGTVYTFTLRDDVKFTNGRVVTAEDFQYAMTRALEPKLNSPVAQTYLNDIVGADDLAAGKAEDLPGIKVVSPTVLEITLVAPRAYFLGKLTYPTAYAVAREEVEKGEKTEGGAFLITDKNSVGTGPFILDTYTPQSMVSLKANPDYFEGAPKVTGIERKIILDAKTARNLYESGELDIVTLEKGDYAQDKDNPDVKPEIKSFDRSATFYLGLNQTQYPPFKDKRVRQAVAYAVNKDALVDSVLQGVNQKAGGVLPKGMPGYDETIKGMAFDPEKAKALLAEAGFPGGKGLPPLTLTFREKQPDLSKTAEVVKEQLAAVGIPVNLNEMEWGAFLKKTDNREIAFFHMRWGADYLDPQNFLSVLLTSTAPENRTGYNNAEYDKLCAEADGSTDPEKRLALYNKAEKIVVEDAPWVPVYYQKDLELVKPYVSGLRDCLMGHLPHTTVEIA
ncbi:MAG: peptide ABC transporter substrate-binding protein [Armatimonadetes bacterium]|nr:peptide ABC transporter substrate-binding protein [Armatimonadota bacterium]